MSRIRLYHHAALTVLLTLSIIKPTPCSAELRCTEIRRVPFANMSISIPDRGVVSFKGGKGYSPEVAGCSTKDWENTIVEDLPLNPEPSVFLRLIRVNSVHITGSGTWNHVIIFRCRNRKLVRIFQRSYFGGVTIRKKTGKEFMLTYGVWLQKDPRCCPSQEAADAYRWDSKRRTYIRVASNLRPSPRR